MQQNSLLQQLAQWIKNDFAPNSIPAEYVKQCPSLTLFTTYLQDSVGRRHCSPFTLFTGCPLPFVPLPPLLLQRGQFSRGPLSLLSSYFLPNMVWADQLSVYVGAKQRLIVMILAKRIWAEVTKGYRRFAANITVMPRAFPFSCRENKKETGSVFKEFVTTLIYLAAIRSAMPVWTKVFHLNGGLKRQETIKGVSC